MSGSSFRVSLRLARRELRRSPVRTALILLLVALPTGAMAAVTTLYRTSEIDGAAETARALGQATMEAHFSANRGGTRVNAANDRDIARLRAALPTDARVLVVHTQLDRVRRPGVAQRLFISDLDLRSPLARGRVSLLRGRLPVSADEAVVTDEVAGSLHLTLSSSMQPQRLGRKVVVVGIADARSLPAQAVVGGALPAGSTTTALIASSQDPPTVAGWDFFTGPFPGYSVDAQVLWTYVGGAIGLLVVGTVVAAAFAVAARRQLRTIGLLSSTGAAPFGVASALATQGVLVGFAGSVVGVVAGQLVVHGLTVATLQAVTLRRVTTPVTLLSDLVPITVIGTLAATIAAAFPALSAARVPTVQALASQRPSRPTRRARLVPALGLLGIGIALLAVPAHQWSNRVTRNGTTFMDTPSAITGVVGVVAVIAGMLFLTPLVIRLAERATARAPLPWKLTARGLARRGIRSTAIVGAICVLVASVIGVATLGKSWTWPLAFGGLDLPFPTQNEVLLSATYASLPTMEQAARGERTQGFEPVPAEYSGRVEAALRTARQYKLLGLRERTVDYPAEFALDVGDAEVVTTFGSTPTSVAATPELLDLFDVPSHVRAELRQGGAVLLRPTKPLHPRREQAGRYSEPRLHVVGIVKSDLVSMATPRVLVSPASVRRYDWRPETEGPTLFVTRAALTRDDRRRLELVRSDIEWAQQDLPQLHTGIVQHQVELQIGADYPTSFGLGFPRPVTVGLHYRWIAYATLAILVLGIVGGGLALSSHDVADERAVMDAVGASPRVRRQMRTRHAALLVLAGCAIGIPVGLGSVGGMLLASNANTTHFRFDVGALFALGIGLPVIAVTATALVAWLRDRERPALPPALVFTD